MKKFIRIFLAIALIFCNSYKSYASFASPIVARLIPASAVAGAAGSITIPALIKGTTSGGLNVSSWLPLLIPGGNVAKIAAAVVAIGGALAVDYLMLKGAAWFAERGINKDASGVFSRTAIFPTPDGHMAAEYQPGAKFGEAVSDGVFADATSASNEAQALRGATCLGVSGHTGLEGGLGMRYYYTYTNCPGVPVIKHLFFYPNPTGMHNETVAYPFTFAQLDTLLGADLAVGLPSANVLGLAAVEAAANALDNPVNPINMNAAIKAAIAAALSGSLTQAQKDALEGQGTTPTTIPVPETTDYTKLTPGQITTAVSAALASQGLTSAQPSVPI